ncbi:MAG: CoA transferase [Burkholderiaceae bacterium]|jgi:crotonobetainyl-CoA:carnitine CoA-transferase CaiB-like acyl-CoA transferase|nr:CoA transferase [Burkholderiaceae bacterium]
MNTTASTTLSPGALEGVRILDLSRVLAGPWATQTLGDMGAQVIKVERPGGGDDSRTWGPPFLKDAAGNDTRDAAYYLCTNRNKQSIAIDITRPEGQALIRELAAKCDVLVENFKVGGLKQYGLDYEAVRAINPHIVYCSITGFGQDGPYAQRPGYDFLMQGMGGLMSVTGRADGGPGAGPMKVGVALTDIMTGLYAAIAILAALRARDAAGQGQQIDLALLDVLVACMANQGMNYLYSGQAPRRMGNAHPNVVPYQDFPTADGHMIVAIGNDEQFARFCVAAGRPEWAADERFKRGVARVANRDVLIAAMREVTATRATREWVALLERANVPCGPINTLADVFDDPQVRARGLRIEVERAGCGAIPLVASPIRLSATPVRYEKAPPALGQDTAAVAAQWLDLSPAQIDELIKKGVLA